MWTLLLGVILGLLAPVQSNPVAAATELPALAAVDFLGETFFKKLGMGHPDANNGTSSSDGTLDPDHLVTPDPGTSDPEDQLPTFDTEEGSADEIEGSMKHSTSGQEDEGELFDANLKPNFNLRPSPIPHPSPTTRPSQSTTEDDYEKYVYNPTQSDRSDPPEEDEEILDTESPTTELVLTTELVPSTEFVPTTEVVPTTEFLPTTEFPMDLEDVNSILDPNPSPGPYPTIDASTTTKLEELEDDIFSPNFVPSPSHSPISDLEEEYLLPLSLDPSFRTTSRPSQSLGTSHTPSSNLTSMASLEEDRAAKINTELTSTSTTRSAALTTVRMNAEMEGSGSGFLPQSSTTVAAFAGEEDQTDNPLVDQPLIEMKTRIQDTNRLAPPREEPAEDTTTVVHEAAAVKPTPSAQHDSYTSGWLIIVAFVAGVAVLVVICVAIGTKDRWNAPAQSSEKKVDRAGSGDEKVEREMERFLSKERPRENGHAGEYTVISLEDLPEKEPLD